MPGETPTPSRPCAHCGAAVCTHPDPLYSGIVVIDRASEPVSYVQHLRDTACMRGHGSVPVSGGAV